jgi:hypothetical protein
MKVKSKLLVCIVSASLTLALTACGGESSSGAASSSATTPVKTTNTGTQASQSNDPIFRACKVFFPEDSVGQATLKENLDLAFMAASLSYESNSAVDSKSLGNIKKYHSDFQKAMNIGSSDSSFYSELNNVDAPFAHAADGADVVSDQMDTTFWNSEYDMVKTTCKDAYGLD